ncbi:MAG TPA: GPR1/FUN34/YaaH family transporter [Gaiellaceae bacterium]|nr:GPR1/FUN34/YaaH family transporter [Gaiellaceae bacterium]
MEERRATALAGTDAGTNGWATRVFLQPIAPPSILGLAGFSVATLMVSLIQAGLLGTWADIAVVGIFAATFGGIAQFAAALWSFRARDAVALLAHGTWGSFWMAFGIVSILIIAGQLAPPAHAANYALGLWFLGLAYMTAIAAMGATLHHFGVASVLWTLAAGSGLSAAGWFLGGIGNTWLAAGGWLFICSAALAAYTVLSMVLLSVSGRAILPSGEYKKAANVPGRKPVRAIELDWAEPGIKQGQ